ncbi:MAG: DUF2924 domain-containing protein [Planctomycetia bacterium]|nr:DUF2924 domain-containing protein [Planctomycetia bacterium]
MKHSTRSAQLSRQAQRQLAELAELLNPLGRMIARAKRRCADKSEVNCRASDAGNSGFDTTGNAGVSAAVGRGRGHGPSRCRDIRLPPPGSMLRRAYKGRDLIVTILESGFEFEGRRYRSLSAIAKVVTGAHWNGLLFFGLISQEK